MTDWSPTPALLRALILGVLGPLGGVLLGQPVLVVLGAPFLVMGVLALSRRPVDRPRIDVLLERNSVHEGERTVADVLVRGHGIEQLCRLVRPQAYVGTEPASGLVSRLVDPASPAAHIGVVLIARRWGRREVGGGQVSATSAWAGFRWGPAPVPTSRLTALPRPAPFRATADAPHPVGLVGANRSRLNGEGTEFSGIRPFVVGDRLRRIHWRTSLRTGDLHVVTTTAEQDSAVIVVVDAFTDVGTGLEASSLDIGVRAAGALAEHHLRSGDRVGLRVLGRSSMVLPPRAGRHHHRRMQDCLAGIEAGPPSHFQASRVRLGFGPGTIVYVVSPLLAAELTATVITLAGSGLHVIVVDTLPRELAERRPPAPQGRSPQGLAWRLRQIERDRNVAQVEHSGTPVVSWRGPGTVDEVLRRLTRRARMPHRILR